MQKNVLAIVGSLRADSFNLKLAQLAQEASWGIFDFEIATLNDIVPFNQDLENDTPEAITQLREKVKLADGIWFFSPEYNHSVPGVLKNTIDWLSRPTSDGVRVLPHKKAALSGITPGMAGTAICQDHLVSVLSFLDVDIMNVPRLTIPHAYDLLKDDVLDLGESTKYLKRQVEAFAAYLDK